MILLLLLCSSVGVCLAEPLLLSALLDLDFFPSLVAIAFRLGQASPVLEAEVWVSCRVWGALFSLSPPDEPFLLELPLPEPLA